MRLQGYAQGSAEKNIPLSPRRGIRNSVRNGVRRGILQFKIRERAHKVADLREGSYGYGWDTKFHVHDKKKEEKPAQLRAGFQVRHEKMAEAVVV